MKKDTALFLLGLALVISPLWSEAARTAVQSVSGYFTTSALPNIISIYYAGGPVGVGTSTPFANGLAVQGLATTTPTPIFNVSSSSSPIFQVLPSRIVVIGASTTAPSIFTVFLEPTSSALVATTTLDFGDYSTTSSRTCFNVKNATGTQVSFYFAAAALVVQWGRCL